MLTRHAKLKAKTLRDAYRRASRAARATLTAEIEELDHLCGDGLEPLPASLMREVEGKFRRLGNLQERLLR